MFWFGIVRAYSAMGEFDKSGFYNSMAQTMVHSLLKKLRTTTVHNIDLQHMNQLCTLTSLFDDQYVIHKTFDLDKTDVFFPSFLTRFIELYFLISFSVSNHCRVRQLNFYEETINAIMKSINSGKPNDVDIFPYLAAILIGRVHTNWNASN